MIIPDELVFGHLAVFRDCLGMEIYIQKEK